MCAEKFSRRFMCEHLLQPLLPLCMDKVPNIRAEIAANMGTIKRTLSKDIKKADDESDITVPKEFNSIRTIKKSLTQKDYGENSTSSKTVKKRNTLITHDKSKIIELGKEVSCSDNYGTEETES